MSESNRRAVLRAGLAAVAAGVAYPALAQQKMAQKAVNYRDKPLGNKKCSTCLHFEAPNVCKVVAGEVNPEGWCTLFAPKPAS